MSHQVVLLVMLALSPTCDYFWPHYYSWPHYETVPITVELAPEPPAPEQPTPPPAVPVSKPRPVITMYTASWCGPCQLAKREIKAIKDRPFDLREIDIDKDRFYTGAVPYFIWPDKAQPTGWASIKPEPGWYGVDALLTAWRQRKE